jgi:hypothetical protein
MRMPCTALGLFPPRLVTYANPRVHISLTCFRISHTYQIIARESKGFLGVDYNRSPETVFATSAINQPRGQCYKTFLSVNYGFSY